MSRGGDQVVKLIWLGPGGGELVWRGETPSDVGNISLYGRIGITDGRETL